MKHWTEAEKAILDAHYAKGGPLACRRHGLNRSLNAMKSQAEKRGIQKVRAKRAAKVEPEWELPRHDLLESLDCVRLRKWRGPVSPGPLVPRMGMTLPTLGMAA